MATITLSYDARSSRARSWLEKIRESGIFKEITAQPTTGNLPEATIEAFKQATSGEPLPAVDTSSLEAFTSSLMQ